jgi:hypothetical protein
MDILLITSDMIENTQVDTKNLCDFLHMVEDYKQEILMNDFRKTLNENEK